MKQYLFLFTIGPVQSFISQARKTQDLYAGSFLLSCLCKRAAKKFTDCGGKLIFPYDLSNQSLPNRFIGEIEADEKSLKKNGETIEKCVRNKFRDIAFRVLEKYNRSIFDKQIEPFLDIYWTFQPLNNYQKDYGIIERTLGAIIKVRSFSQLEEIGRKCSLCGERNVLFYRLNDKEIENGGLKVRKDGLLKKLYAKKEDIVFYEPEGHNNLKIQKGEGLCSVCFTKRFVEKYFKDSYEKHFPSTAKIALMDWLEKIPKDAKHAYKDLFNNFDEQLYYEENLREKYLKKYGQFKDDKSLSEANKQLKKFYDIKDENGDKIGKPSKYYALVMLDGDNMGKWLSGEYLEERGKASLEEFHKKVSEKLGKYAANVEKQVIQAPKGKLVYAGGDDVLAFVNLKHLFDVLTKLQKEFPKFEELGFSVKGNHKSSASAGIVIAHYKTPLSETLKWARKMEHEAKDDGGRDAFAIAVLKHSGEIRKTRFKWMYGDSSTIKILENLVKSFKTDFSDTFFRNLGTEFMQLMDKDGKYNNKPLVKTEIKRLIKRSCMMKNDNIELKNRTISDLTDKLSILHTHSDSLINFISALSIAEFIERGGAI